MLALFADVFDRVPPAAFFDLSDVPPLPLARPLPAEFRVERGGGELLLFAAALAVGVRLRRPEVAAICDSAVKVSLSLGLPAER